MSTSPVSALNALLARLFQEPDLLQRVQSDPQAVFREAGLTEQECRELQDGSFGALHRIHVHPVLRMHYQMATKPEIGQHVTIREYLPELLQERHHG